MQQLLSQLTKDPPTGYARVSAGQVIRADREMFTLMAQEIEGSLQPDAAGRFPMGEENERAAHRPKGHYVHVASAKGGAERERKERHEFFVDSRW